MNLRVQTPDEILGGLSKPQLEAVQTIKLSQQDCMIVCAGFEDRALNALQMAIAEGHDFRVVLIDYLPFFPENKAQDIRTLCAGHGIQVVDLTYDRESPAGFGRGILDAVSNCSGRLYIDVSAMSRLLIVQILVALGGRLGGFGKTSVVYSEAAEYPPSKTDAETELAKSKSDPTFAILFLSSGVFDVTVVPELSSIAPPGTQTRLIAFPSLDAHQMTALRAEIQPSRISLIEGVPPNSNNQWRQALIADINCVSQIENVERFSTSTLDYRETLDCLLKLYSQHSVRERILISPTGSKMQTLAVGILRAFVEDIQIVYPTPASFRSPSSYTKKVGTTHILDCDAFGLGINQDSRHG